MNRLARTLTAAVTAAAACLIVPAAASARPADPVALAAATSVPGCSVGTSYLFGQIGGDMTVTRSSQWCMAAVTTSGKIAKLAYQGDGNLVLYIDSRALWQSGTADRGSSLVLQRDGNVVIYDINNRPLWWTNTGGDLGRRIVVQSDGNAVIYKTDFRGYTVPVWQSGTSGRG